MTGLFIVLEGVEGSGKSTQARLLAEWLRQRGIPHVSTREPGGTPIGEEIRALLLQGADIPAETELMLVLAARAAHVHAVIRPALGRGEIVVCDRYELSTLAYQGIARGLGLERVKAANDLATGGLKPDLTIVVAVEAEEGEARRAAVRAGADRIERAGREFHAQVAKAYRLLAEEESTIELVDGRPAPEVVHETIVRLLRTRFSETILAKAG